MIAPRLGSDPSVTDVYSADGTTGWSGVPKVCSPLRSIVGYGIAVSSGHVVVAHRPAVVAGALIQVWDGRVYVQETDGYTHVLGLPGSFS